MDKNIVMGLKLNLNDTMRRAGYNMVKHDIGAWFEYVSVFYVVVLQRGVVDEKCTSQPNFTSPRLVLIHESPAASDPP